MLTLIWIIIGSESTVVVTEETAQSQSQNFLKTVTKHKMKVHVMLGYEKNNDDVRKCLAKHQW